MSTLQGDTVVVTGGGTGVGRALAREVCARGADVVVIDVDDPAETVELISASGGRARGLIVDVRDERALHALATEISGKACAPSAYAPSLRRRVTWLTRWR